METDDGDARLSGRTNKRRKGRKKRGAEPDTHGEVVKAGPKVALPHQLGFYKGLLLDILKLALRLYGLYLLTKNGYPDATEQFKQTKACFLTACRMILGVNYKGKSIVRRRQKCYNSCSLAKKPVFTDGMSRLVSSFPNDIKC